MSETPPVSSPPPPRPLKEIALDLMQYPLNLPEGERFDSGKRVSKGYNFLSYLQEQIDISDEVIGNSGPGLLARLTDRPVPKKPIPEAGSPDLTIAHSVVAMQRLRDVLMDLGDTGETGERGLQTIRAAAWPLTQTLAQAEEQRAAEERGSKGDVIQKGLAGYQEDMFGTSREDSLRNQAQRSDEAAASFERNAHNLRHGITPLFEELAAALGTSLSKGPHVS